MKLTTLLFTLFATLIMTEISSANTNTVAACPDKPNCVSSNTFNANQIEPFRLIISNKQSAASAWTGISNIVKKQIRTQIIMLNDTHLHAEVRSLIFRFTDDLNLVLDTQQNLVHVRSASRVGYYDFGANKHRIDRLRLKLRKAGLIQ